jgi:Tol biopolymer transport system component
VSNIWSYDLVRLASNRVSFSIANDNGPVWAPDGRSLVYVANHDGRAALIRKPANGTGAEEIVYELPEAMALKDGIFDVEAIDWSPDGRYLMVEVVSGPRRSDLFTLDLSVPNHQLTPLIVTPFTEKSARFSNDGRWITYHSDESGTTQIYAQPFPATGARWQVSIDGGEDPRWRGDGGEIYFVNRDKSIVAVPVTVHGSDLAIGKPVRALDGASNDYEVTPDGNTFFIAMRTPSPGSPMNVVTNWTSGLDSH